MNRTLFLISLGVLLASSTWFSGTAVMPALATDWGLSGAESAWLTISTQLGFIVGTFAYALLNLADLYNARRVFFASAVAGAVFNAGFAWLSNGLGVAILLRFATGVTLAGVYPVGMKIVASWFRSGLGWRLGVMVGALTLGTASPYLLSTLTVGLSWRVPVGIASGLALAGGAVLVLLVGDGPHLRRAATFDPGMLIKVFRDRRFRYAAYGYFGHMWELYAFWALVSSFIGSSFVASGSDLLEHVPLIAFITIGVGALGCAVGGWVSRTVGERRVALVSLYVSGLLCATSGFLYELPAVLLIAFVLVWGVFVVSDSPQFSALAARYCPPEYTGTALTVQNGVGFALTIVSLQLLPILADEVGWRWAMVFLAVGPLIGAYFTHRLGTVADQPGS